MRGSLYREARVLDLELSLKLVQQIGGGSLRKGPDLDGCFKLIGGVPESLTTKRGVSKILLSDPLLDLGLSGTPPVNSR